MDLPPDLLERLTRLHAASVLDQDVAPYDTFLCLLFPAEPVRLACDLLVAGIESPAVIALACESPTRLTIGDGEPILRQLFTELDIKSLNTHQAAWIIARDIARGIENGQLGPADGGHLLYGLQYSCGDPEEMRPLFDALDEWEQTTPRHQDLDRLSATMQTIARAVIRATPEHLADPGQPAGTWHGHSDSSDT